jgi:hypothetical protein
MSSVTSGTDNRKPFPDESPCKQRKFTLWVALRIEPALALVAIVQDGCHVTSERLQLGDLRVDPRKDGLQPPALRPAGGVPAVSGVEAVDDLVEG